MWLPKDEQKMLLHVRKELSKTDKEELPFDECARIIPNGGAALNQLIERDLVEITAMQNNSVPTGEGVYFHQNAWITLTIAGRDLADQYASWWHYSKLWYQQYLKGNPIWVPIAVILTLILTLLSQHIYDRIFPSQ